LMYAYSTWAQAKAVGMHWRDGWPFGCCMDVHNNAQHHCGWWHSTTLSICAGCAPASVVSEPGASRMSLLADSQIRFRVNILWPTYLGYP
jgi:hypothetical protein